MTTAKECRELAAACLRWAAEAGSEQAQDTFLRMGSDWTAAALRVESLLERSNNKGPKEPSAA
jgi:hypothetical protein